MLCDDYDTVYNTKLFTTSTEQVPDTTYFEISKWKVAKLLELIKRKTKLDLTQHYKLQELHKYFRENSPDYYLDATKLEIGAETTCDTKLMKPFKERLKPGGSVSQTEWAINNTELSDPGMVQIDLNNTDDKNTKSLLLWSKQTKNNEINANYYCITHKQEKGYFRWSNISKKPFLKYLHTLLNDLFLNFYLF